MVSVKKNRSLSKISWVYIFQNLEILLCVDGWVKHEAREHFSGCYKPIYTPIFILSHTLVYNGGFSNFELPLLVRHSTHASQILCGLSYKVWSFFITKCGTTDLFILILDITAIIHQSTCCYVVTTSKIVLYPVHPGLHMYDVWHVKMKWCRSSNTFFKLQIDTVVIFFDLHKFDVRET